ncbi:HTH domain-containing protein [Bifidobacterium platyrrhinorum]|uniref:Uncharacterized protein n=1 Tax=Bifidobacterium platyrrhinorum TaxID=2661628 RepID=A0A6L9SVQ4_9BIFI|nr:hypothetical protein [Bifidobacterium platyrrhinorum]
MAHSTFTKEEVAYLYSLPAVSRVIDGRITYDKAFKRECVRQYLAGRSPSRIFREAGLDPELVGYKRIERCMARWKERYGDEVSGAAGRDGEDLEPLPAGHGAAYLKEIGQQIHRIEELENTVSSMRTRIMRLTNLLQRDALSSAGVADDVSVGDAGDGVGGGVGTAGPENGDAGFPGEGHASEAPVRSGAAAPAGSRGATHVEVYVVERDDFGNVVDMRMFVNGGRLSHDVPADVADALAGGGK